MKREKVYFIGFLLAVFLLGLVIGGSGVYLVTRQSYEVQRVIDEELDVVCWMSRQGDLSCWPSTDEAADVTPEAGE